MVRLVDFMATHDHSRNHAVALAAPAEDLCLAFANTRYWRGRERADGNARRLQRFTGMAREKFGIGAPLLWSRANRWASRACPSAAAAPPPRPWRCAKRSTGCLPRSPPATASRGTRPRGAQRRVGRCAAAGEADSRGAPDMAGRQTPRRRPSRRCWRPCCGPRPIFSPTPATAACGAAPMTSACGCSWITARAGRGAGAT